METFENFKVRNASFGSYGYPTKEDMEKCYEIAKGIEKTYNEKYGSIEGPRIGDIVELSDGFTVYRHGKIVENHYGGSEYGMLCICEQGTSFTNGKYFSTSGGAFRHIHKSKLQYVGEDVNMVWTWGCYGAGANQGVYFPLKVRKWIVPYEQPLKASFVNIRARSKERSYAVRVENSSNCYSFECFESVRAFKAWAEYVGFEYERYNSTFNLVSPQHLQRTYVCEDNQIPKNGKPLKMIHNGRCRDAWAVKEGYNIIIFIDHRPQPEAHYGSEEFEKEMALCRKYGGNPLGV